MTLSRILTIGEVAARGEIATSALRYYESVGLIRSSRNTGNQRRFERSVLRRVAVIKAAQAMGISLDDIRDALDRLPDGRTPSRRDWERMSAAWKSQLDERITRLEKLRDDLSSCIGCGCLSIDKCRLFNPDDELASQVRGGSKLISQSSGAKTDDRNDSHGDQ